MKSIIPFLFQLTVDMVYFCVAMVQVADELTVHFEIDNINVVKVLLYIACERCVFNIQPFVMIIIMVLHLYRLLCCGYSNNQLSGYHHQLFTLNESIQVSTLWGFENV